MNEEPQIKEEDRKQVHEELKDKFEQTFNLDDMKPQKHIWVDRGLVMSCEGAGHANHRAFKRVNLVEPSQNS